MHFAGTWIQMRINAHFSLFFLGKCILQLAGKCNFSVLTKNVFEVLAKNIFAIFVKMFFFMVFAVNMIWRGLRENVFTFWQQNVILRF